MKRETKVEIVVMEAKIAVLSKELNDTALALHMLKKNEDERLDQLMIDALAISLQKAELECQSFLNDALAITE